MSFGSSVPARMAWAKAETQSDGTVAARPVLKPWLGSFGGLGLLYYRGRNN